MDTDFDITDEEKEDENLTPEQRQARFGQFDHVRIYGKDYFARMRDAELPITLLKMAEEDCRTYDLFSWEEIMVVNPPEHLLKCFSCSNP